MSTFVVDGIRLDICGEVSHVRWFRTDAARNQMEEAARTVEVDQVVAALDHSDLVLTRFLLQGHWVAGPRVVRKVLPGGRETIDLAVGDDKRQLTDLERI